MRTDWSCDRGSAGYFDADNVGASLCTPSRAPKFGGKRPVETSGGYFAYNNTSQIRGVDTITQAIVQHNPPMSTEKEPLRAPPGAPELSQAISGDRAQVQSNSLTESSVQRSGVVIGIPAYNEGDTIESVVADALQYADEVVVVDDGSTDETAQLAQAAGATVIVHPQNKGYGATIQTLFARAHDTNASYLVTLDGDGQHEISDSSALVETCRNTDASVVIASRFLGGSTSNIPLYRRFGLAVINLLSNLAIRVRGGNTTISDTQSGFRAYDASAIEAVVETENIGFGMDASLDILFHVVNCGHNITEIPTTINYDIDGSSTHNPFAHGFNLIRAIAVEFARIRD